MKIRMVTLLLLLSLLFVTGCFSEQDQPKRIEVEIVWWSYSSSGFVDTMVLHLKGGQTVKIQYFIPFEFGATYELWIRPIRATDKFEVIALTKR